ncbi:hypothetical protein G6F22_015922 [Rhizopus arrhizus]|nr:hypothetical protein G6F22_015922 [Rhizopus arrhizus]
MVAGNPLRIQQGHRAGFGRHGGGDLEDAAGQVTRIHVDAQQAGRCGIGRRRGLRQRQCRRGGQREQQRHGQGSGFHRAASNSGEFPDARPVGCVAPWPKVMARANAARSGKPGNKAVSSRSTPCVDGVHPEAVRTKVRTHQSQARSVDQAQAQFLRQREHHRFRLAIQLADAGRAQLGQAREHAIDQHLRRRGACGDADVLLACHPRRVDLVRAVDQRPGGSAWRNRCRRSSGPASPGSARAAPR